MAIIFLYISIDEAVVIHEMLNEPLRDALELSGAFYWGWVIPATIFVAVFGLAYLGFLLHLGRRIRFLFVLSGAIYVFGALGTEFPLAYWYEEHGSRNFTYGLLSLAQEGLEMLGVTLFCSALLSYLAAHCGKPQIGFDADGGAGKPSG